MKKRIIIVFLLLLSGLIQSFTAQSQAGHANIGVQPLWGPVGYDYVQYYYIPDIDAYYDVPNAQFIYFDNGQWINARTLPPRLADYDLYRAHKVVINQPTPWKTHDSYVNQYNIYRGRYDDQVPIRDSHEEKYWENINHPQHAKWHGENEHGEPVEHVHDDSRR